MDNTLNTLTYAVRQNNDINYNDINLSYRKVRIYRNPTHLPITVTERSGLRITVRPESTEFDQTACLTIQDCYLFNFDRNVSDFVTELEKHLALMGPNYAGDLFAIKECLKSSLSRLFSSTTYNVLLERKIPLQDIRENNNIYVQEADVVVSYPGVKQAPHPESVLGMYEQQVGRLVSDHAGSGVFVEIVDNHNSIGKRYLFVAGQVVEVAPKVDHSRKDGVYFTAIEDNKIGEPRKRVDYAELADCAGKFRLFGTREEAITSGDPGLLLERELKELQHSNEQLKAQAAQDKAIRDAEIDRIRHESQIQIMSLEQQTRELTTLSTERKAQIDRLKDELEAKRLVRNDYYDERSTVRKDTSEFIRWLPAIVAGAAVVITLAKK